MEAVTILIIGLVLIGLKYSVSLWEVVTLEEKVVASQEAYQDTLETGHLDQSDKHPIVTQETEKVKELMDVNQATIEELCEVKGIGEVLANRIIVYRKEIGPFYTLEQLIEVKGIGKVKWKEIIKEVKIDLKSIQVFY
jgi:competence ComEA-like helix-hairpin-helix protein